MALQLQARPDHTAVVRAYVELTDSIADDTELDDLLRRVAAHLTLLTGAARCSLYLLDPAFGTFHGRVAVPEAEDTEAIRRLRCGVAADEFTREIVATLAPVVISDARSDARPVRAAMRAWNIRSMLGVPLVLRHAVIAIAYLDEPGVAHEFAPATRSAAAAFGALAARAIDAFTREQALRAHAAELRGKGELLQRASTVDDRLINLLLGAPGLDGIAAAVHRLTGQPCLIWGADVTLLAAAGAAEQRGALATTAARGALAAQLSGLRPGRPELIGPATTQLLAAPIVAADAVLGYIALAATRARPGARDLVAIRRAAVVAGAELITERRVREALADAQALLLREVLHRGGVEQARRLGLGNGPHVVCLFRRREHHPGPVVTDAGPPLSCDVVADATGATLLADVGNRTVAALVRAGAGVELTAAIDTLSADGAVFVAVSTPATDATQLADAFAQATQALDCLEQLAGERVGSVGLAVDDLGPARLLLGAGLDTAAAYAQRTLRGLLDPTDRARAELLATLDAYVAAGRNTKRAAIALDVHENTVRYRLGRVADITGLNVQSDPVDQVNAHIALMILRLNGRLALRSAGGCFVAVH